MKAAYTGWTWLTAKDAETAKKQLEQSFKECKFLGYDYVENFAFIGDYFEDPNELIEMEKRCGVELVNLYGHFGTDVEENIKVGKKQIDFLAPKDAQRFLAALESEPLFWRCFMNVLITCGLRRGEANGLQWGDIDGDTFTLNVARNVTIDKNSPDKIHIGETKGKESRTVPLSPRVYAMLMTFKHEQEEKYNGKLLPSAYIFCSTVNPYAPQYPTVPTRWQARFVKRHNLPNVSPHDLRHTAATLALEGGADLKQVQQLLGHKDPATTMRFYAGVTEEAERRTVQGIESVLASGES